MAVGITRVIYLPPEGGDGARSRGGVHGEGTGISELTAQTRSPWYQHAMEEQTGDSLTTGTAMSSLTLEVGISVRSDIVEVRKSLRVHEISLLQ